MFSGLFPEESYPRSLKTYSGKNRIRKIFSEELKKNLL